MTASFDLKQAIAARQLGQPQRNYLWRVILPDITQGPTDPQSPLPSRSGFFNAYGYNPYSLGVTNQVANVATLSARVKSVSVPYPSLETDKETVGNTYWYYGKKHDIGGISLEIMEYEDGGTFQYLYGWTMMTILPCLPNAGPAANTGTPLLNTNNPPLFYKFPITLLRLDTKKLDLYLDTFNGFFPTNITASSSDYESSGFLTYTVAFTGDQYTGRVLQANGNTISAVEQNIMSQALNIQSTFTGISTGDLESLIPSLFNEIGATL